jgi:ATP-binding cassette subfamily C protein CydD
VLTPELYAPLRNLATQFHASADGLSVAERLLDLLDEPERDAGGVEAPSPHDVVVRLESVSYAYPGREGQVLQSVDLELPPGETVVLVGPSGAGKSTIASLLLLLASPNSGRVTAGDVDLRTCDAAAWRARLAWVPQRPTIFRGTVADNIRIGAEHATDAEVRTAAALAGADRFVRALPDGYDTLVGDGGRPLSAGERRRLALARAFVRDASLVVLDEPTAHLDSESVELVSTAVERLGQGRTMLVIAHRPEVAPHADRIISLQNGRLLEVHTAVT